MARRLAVPPNVSPLAIIDGAVSASPYTQQTATNAGQTSDMWAARAADVVHDHTVVVPDLRGVVPDSGHRIMEENPAETIRLIRDFLAAKAD